MVAASEAEALRLAAEDAADASTEASDQLLIDGQEEVFARAEVETRPEHKAEAGSRVADSAAAQAEGSGDR
jgi:hypothetical protein